MALAQSCSFNYISFYSSVVLPTSTDPVACATQKTGFLDREKERARESKSA
jgi:hypothetical protein